MASAAVPGPVPLHTVLVPGPPGSDETGLGRETGLSSADAHAPGVSGAITA